MSIQAECREAMNRLANQGGVFTEIDVVNEASTDSWSSKHFEQAARNAYSVLQGDYKKGTLVRYGPVSFQGTDDYARRATKIVYGDAHKGPKEFVTPNGSFPRLRADKDDLLRAGRRVGTNRDDTKPWEGQTVSKKSTKESGPPVDTAPLLKRIEQLQAENERLRAAKPLPAVATAGGVALELASKPRTTVKSNGNGNGEPAVPVALADLVDILAERVAPLVERKVTEGIKNSMAEALIS